MLFRCICMYILASAIKLEVIRSIENFALKMGGRGGGEWGAGKKREGSGIFRNGRATQNLGGLKPSTSYAPLPRPYL